MKKRKKEKFYRFMSFNELYKFVENKELENTKTYDGASDSVGFCFLKEDVITSIDVITDPFEFYEFLQGFVSGDVLCIFEADPKDFHKGHGAYRCPVASCGDTMYAEEFSIRKYSKDNFKLLKVYPFFERQYSDYYNCLEEMPNINFEDISKSTISYEDFAEMMSSLHNFYSHLSLFMINKNKMCKNFKYDADCKNCPMANNNWYLNCKEFMKEDMNQAMNIVWQWSYENEKKKGLLK